MSDKPRFRVLRTERIGDGSENWDDITADAMQFDEHGTLQFHTMTATTIKLVRAYARGEWAIVEEV